jgi:hypothetical protein
MQCEVSRSAGYDPTGEWAVECGAEGEYCPICEIVVCGHCHQAIATDPKHQQQQKKPPAKILANSDRRKTGTQ